MMFNPDESEPLNPVEDGSGYYNKLADNPEISRYNEAMITANKGFSDNEADKRATLLTKTPTKQNVELVVDDQYGKRGTPKRKTQRTPAKLRFNVTETQASPVIKKSNTTKHTRSASTGQQYIQPSPPPSPKFKHPYQQLKGGDPVDHEEHSTGYANIAVDGSPRLNKVSSDSPVHVDIGSPVSSFFKEALQSTPQSKHSMPSVLTAVTPSFTVASGNNSMVTETPVSMITAHGTSNVWGVSPQRPAQQENTGNMAPGSEWIVSAELREKFKTQFQDLKPENGLLFGEKARVFFLKSKLQSKDLSAIWKLADIDKDGKLSEEEFCVAMKMVLVRRKGYDIPSTIPEQLLPSKPSVLPHSTFQASTVTARDDAMATSYLPTLPTLQQQQLLKSQTLPVGIKPPTSSKYPAAQLPLLPPPSRKHFTRTNTGESPMTSRFNGIDEQGNSPTSDHHAQSRIVGLSHSNWPSALTSDNGKPLKFDSHIEPTVPLPQTPTDAPYCPVDNNNMEKSNLVDVASGNSKHKMSGPPIIDLGPKPEPVSANEPVNAPVKTKTKIALVPISKDDSGDEEIFDSEDDETSALYAVVKPRGTKGKSSELKAPKHSTVRSSNSFKKHKPKPPPKPEPYSSGKYKKKSLSPSPVPAADTVAVEDSGYVDPSNLDVQEQASTDNHDKVESSIAVDDPAALYAKVIKKKPSMELMEPITLGQDVALLATLVEKKAVDKDYTEASGNSQVIVTSTTATVDDTSETIDGVFASRSGAAQLISVTKVDSDDANPVTITTTEESKPVPMPRRKHHRSSSLDLNKMFQKRKSAEQLAVSPDSLTKDLPSAVPPKPPPKPRKPKPVSNLENELMPQISRSASLDSINSAAGNMGIVSTHLQLLEKNTSQMSPVLQRFSPHDESQLKKKKPLLPPHLRSNQSDSQVSKSDSSNELVASGNSSQEHTEKRDKVEIQKNIKALQEETKALVQLNHDLQQMLTRLMEERTILQTKLDASTKHHTVS